MMFAYALLMAASSATPPPPPAPESDDGAVFAQMTIRQTVVVRVPLAPPLPPPMPPRPIEWREKSGPKCLEIGEMAGAALLGSAGLLLIMRGGNRYRAQLEKTCDPDDFYQGFYVTPTADGRVCAKRDTIRSRIGGECGIRTFRALSQKR